MATAAVIQSVIPTEDLGFQEQNNSYHTSSTQDKEAHSMLKMCV